MGSKPGQGRGGLAGESPSSVAFQTERGKVHTGRGAIIGQFRVEGEQIKGDVTEEISELISASHRDATDRISRDRLPRQYHKAVKTYFSTASEKFRATASGKNPNPEKKKAAQTKPDASED